MGNVGCEARDAVTLVEVEGHLAAEVGGEGVKDRVLVEDGLPRPVEGVVLADPELELGRQVAVPVERVRDAG